MTRRFKKKKSAICIWEAFFPTKYLYIKSHCKSFSLYFTCPALLTFNTNSSQKRTLHMTELSKQKKQPPWQVYCNKSKQKFLQIEPMLGQLHPKSTTISSLAAVKFQDNTWLYLVIWFIYWNPERIRRRPTRTKRGSYKTYISMLKHKFNPAATSISYYQQQEH